ncbi:polar amino acid transport system substrate-binding protein [Nocardia amikacinitolerans]|uniref:Polar amino acid transport system substrate-binding protein n=2 Tax=Nocardia amikacinitolerans TaxID=756689 RepID=A0A285LXX3_9NOCA|nr:polar amino acid transport system substrate-binding protein [Nocardia amikacinitolerans]MCP2299300.1 polar amino acid transport system substrate-binding protein [Nocardia amikacinitolerans]SNY89762.1 polar amino acid transport system substrate-binding protein [Nocardia amikacinitolerans]
MSDRSKPGRRALRAMCALTGAALVLAGCTTNTEETGPAVSKVQVDKVTEIADQLPDKIKQSGKLVIGVNVPYQPNEYKDASGKIVGFDVDLMDAVTSVLGIKAEYVESAFEKIIPAIQAGTYDVGMSSITDSKEREQQVDFTTYFSAGIQWAQQTGKPIDPNNACGKKVAVQATTVEHTDEVPAKSAKCVAEGKPAIDIKPFDEQSAATNALVLGQVDAMSADSPVTAYAIKQSNGKIETAGPVFDSAPYGWAVPKGSPLAKVLQAAVNHLIKNGQYKQITENWGVQDGAITESVINGAVS